MVKFDPACLQDLLKPYYDRLFPVQWMYRWLSYGSDDLFSRREFSFTLAGDVYIRYQSFGNQEEFSKELKRRNPEKIDIGAVYTQNPKVMKETSSVLMPVEKEFVLDIDLTDYDDVRSCCSGATVCELCWKFISLAVKILDAALRDDFGFKHLLWVYSGRRGVHCWVCDDATREMDSSARGAVIEYLSVIRGGETQVKKVKIPNPDHIHPFIQRALTIISEKFEEICDEDQEVFADDKNYNVLPDDVKAAVKSTKTRFSDVMEYIRRNPKKKTIRALLLELKLQFCYPRLDVNVSKGINHLLKSPFCIHPKTGQVCVPFDPKHVDSFQTIEVPRITQLLEEIGDHDKNNENAVNLHDWKKTSMEPYMKIFTKFVNGLESDTKAKAAKKKRKEESSIEVGIKSEDLF